MSAEPPPPPPVSPDGIYYWDGAKWQSTLSHDGRQRWNGTAWIPVSQAPQTGPALREPTTWTRPLQFAVAGWFALQAAYAASQPFWYISTMTQYANAMNQREQALHPGAPSPPPEALASANGIATVMFAIGIVLVVGVSVAVIVAAFKRWTWAHYVVMAVLALEFLSSAGGLASTAAFSALAGEYAGPPGWMVALNLVSALVSAALFALMLVAVAQKGPWAMKKVSA
ncbi:MAG TPA: hypothetical protein VIJ91_04885 [Candidatus Dormibacteraeota bacterium]